MQCAALFGHCFSRSVVVGGLGIMLNSAASAAGPELWFYNQTNLAVQANVDATKALIDRASASGYSYMLLADTKLNYDGNPALNSIWDPNWGYYTKLASVINYGKSKRIEVVPGALDVGRAENWLLNLGNQNWAEGQPVRGATYTVAPDGNSLIFAPQNPSLTNMSFESGSTGWSLDAGRASIDSSVAYSGSSSLKISAGGARGYGIQTISVQPNRQYHVSFYAKTASLNGELMAKIYDPSVGRFREFHEEDSAMGHAATQNWTRYDYVFNSAQSTSVQLRLGSWGSTSGTMWFDSVNVEEIGLHNIVRNSQSPLKLYRPDGTVLSEGTDVNPIQEPYSLGSGMTFRLYRTPLTPTIPAGSSLHPGDTVKIDYDAVQPIYDGQYGVSLSEPAVKTYYANVITELRKSFAPGSGIMMLGYDEIRHGNSSTGNVAAGLTAGQLLADNFKDVYDIIRAQDPNAPLYTWSDMFDPFHNARDKFYLWDGDLAGSWNGLPADVTIFNWNAGNPDSLKFFSDRGNQQLIAGYYDQWWDPYGAGLGDALKAVGVNGVRGAMYTPWWSGFDGLEAYADGVRAGWVDVPEPSMLALVVAGLPLLMRRRPR